jgi:hypothetical protein
MGGLKTIFWKRCRLFVKRRSAGYLSEMINVIALEPRGAGSAPV